MKNYSHMSNAEITESVAMALYGKLSRGTQERIANGEFDYCDSWADAGPIIQKNKIPINPVSSYWQAGAGIDKPLVCDINPLRAAMIVLLMMKDNENA